MQSTDEPISMGIIPAQKIKYNLSMNKEIIHQAAQAHAEKSFIQPLNAQEK
jgi:hypothetical protein